MAFSTLFLRPYSFRFLGLRGFGSRFAAFRDDCFLRPSSGFWSSDIVWVLSSAWMACWFAEL